MYRKIYEYLINWKKNDIKRKPLLVTGARQTGKTFIINEFGKEFYDNVLEVNFEKEPKIVKFFEESLDPKLIIKKLENYYNKRILPKNTLIFFDEIQACERAITSLKYFNEEANDYHIICAGSLLGVVLNRKQFSYPVGKVQEIKMYPMDFEEYLIALNENILLETIKKCYKENVPLDNLLHDKCLSLYRNYLAIGGMPEAVNEYVETNSIISTVEIIETIYSNYLNDMSKYTSSNEVIKNRACYESIVKQLNKENKNFKYSEVQKGKNSQYYGESLNWLISAGVALKSKLVTIPKIPLSFHEDEFLFRIYLSDTGLFRYKAGINISDLTDPSYKDDLIGILTENYVACELTSKGIPLRYWKGKRESEIEFIVEYNRNVVPMEVKTGIRTNSVSLKIYRDNYKTDTCILISQKNFGYNNGIKSIPLYAVFCLADDLKRII